MYVATIPNRTSPPAILIRESYREDDKIKSRTIANITRWPKQRIEVLKGLLRGDFDKAMPDDEVAKQGKAIGAIFTLREVSKKIGLDSILGRTDRGRRALFLVFARLMIQGSRLKAARWAEEEAIEETLGIDEVDENDLYEVLDWLSANQEKMEKSLFHARHVAPPALFLYDVTSSYLEGEQNELADYGYNRDKKKGKKQIVIGLLADPEGDPVAVRVFEGNTADPNTVEEQIKTLTTSFGVTEVVLVGDRGMLKKPQIESLPEGFRYITAITKPQIRSLLGKGILQMDLFEDSLAEVVHEKIRYILRRNPERKKEIEQNREAKTERIRAFVTEKNTYLADHPKADPKIAQRDIDEKIKRFNMDAWIKAVREERVFHLTIDEDARGEETLLDGCYVIKSDVPEAIADKHALHERYKDLALVEQDFRDMKTACLEVRPVYVRKEKRTRGHVFVVMLALILKRHMERLLDAAYGKKRPAVSEALRALDRLCLQERDVEGIPFRYIPIPDERQSAYLTALGVTLPKKLVGQKRHAHVM
jgi:transposase